VITSAEPTQLDSTQLQRPALWSLSWPVTLWSLYKLASQNFTTYSKLTTF